MPDSWEQYEDAGDDWLSGFMKRLPELSLWYTQATSIIACSTNFNSSNVKNEKDDIYPHDTDDVVLLFTKLLAKQSDANNFWFFLSWWFSYWVTISFKLLD